MNIGLIQLDDKILYGLRESIENYLLLMCNENEKETLLFRLNTINNLYIDKNLQFGMLQVGNDIKINSSFAVLDENDNFVEFRKDQLDVIFTQLIHEMCHIVSDDSINNRNGIQINDGNNFYDRTNFYLNEGITQLFAEKISNINIDKISQSYNDTLNIAKLLKVFIGEDVLFNSYFLQSNILQKKYNELAGENSFETLSSSLNEVYYIQKKFKKEDAFELRNNLIENIYSQILMGVVLPVYSSGTETDKKNYQFEIHDLFKYDVIRRDSILNFLNSIDHNYDVQKNATAYTKVYEEVTKESENIINEKEIKQNIEKSFDLLEKKLIIKSNGNVYYENTENEITDQKLISKIYINFYKKYSKNNDLNLNDIKTQIYKEGRLFLPSDNITLKRGYLEYIKLNLAQENIIILNSIYEVDSNDYIKIDKINSNNYEKITYQGLKKLKDRYKLVDNKIIDNVTNKTIKDKRLLDYLKFNLILEFVSSQLDDTKAHKLFDDLSYSYNKYGQINLVNIKDIETKNLINRMMFDRQTVEIINTFYSENCNKKLLEHSHRLVDNCSFYNFIDNYKNENNKLL